MKAKSVFRKREGRIPLILIFESVCLYIHGLEVNITRQLYLEAIRANSPPPKKLK